MVNEWYHLMHLRSRALFRHQQHLLRMAFRHRVNPPHRASKHPGDNRMPLPAISNSNKHLSNNSRATIHRDTINPQRHMADTNSNNLVLCLLLHKPVHLRQALLLPLRSRTYSSGTTPLILAIVPNQYPDVARRVS